MEDFSSDGAPPVELPVGLVVGDPIYGCLTLKEFQRLINIVSELFGNEDVFNKVQAIVRDADTTITKRTESDLIQAKLSARVLSTILEAGSIGEPLYSACRNAYASSVARAVLMDGNDIEYARRTKLNDIIELLEASKKIDPAEHEKVRTVLTDNDENMQEAFWWGLVSMLVEISDIREPAGRKSGRDLKLNSNPPPEDIIEQSLPRKLLTRNRRGRSEPGGLF